MTKFEDLLPQDTEAMWTCGHVGGAVCAECHRELTQRANELAAEVDHLREMIRVLEMSLYGKT